MPADSPLVLSEVPFDDPRVTALVAQVQAYYVEIYGGPDESPVDPREFDSPTGLFVIGTVDGEPVAMGGWRLRPELFGAFGGRVAEVKRMFVSPRVRRRGFAATVLERLVATAREAGVDALVLETGTAQSEAVALYEAAGWVPTLAFGHYAASGTSRYYGLSLTGGVLPPPDR
ncbi:acetyltransferase (GNAT) family protein [Knoellia remsis]|uniref:Acetyltransferase (GNAT) family protein n=1 Tax=Knoellia remsis TaxID=407159 RepID=A0A2T0UFJ2_9MICO|nr:GNAT family N-acetyltransferase [Knoellia remsis]PRY56672.1 acetyltransferase (GNAT) family protein [Knoellia remsis]